MTEDDLELTRRRTLMHKGGVIMGIGKSGRTGMFEELREGGSSTCLRTVVVVSATQFIGAKRLTSALAGDHLSISRRAQHLKLSRACF